MTGDFTPAATKALICCAVVALSPSGASAFTIEAARLRRLRWFAGDLSAHMQDNVGAFAGRSSTSP